MSTEIKTDPLAWFKDFPGSIFVCDAQGILLEMNTRAEKSVESDGGRSLIGKSIIDCHPEPARSKFKQMLAQQEPNIYTIEKNGVKKLIYQVPYYTDGVYAGFVELSLEIPFAMPHFVREP
jgi:transcriptional regulator with PAS, ATPase and Fis domain